MRLAGSPVVFLDIAAKFLVILCKITVEIGRSICYSNYRTDKFTELKTVCTRTAPQWDFLGSEADKKMPLPDMGMGGCIRN